MSLQRIAAAATLVAISMAPAGLAATSLQSAQRARLAPAVAAAWDHGDTSFQVIVHLAAPDDARLPIAPRGVEQPRALLDAVHRTVSSEVGALRARYTAADLDVTQAFRLQPAFAATVSRQALANLAADPRVDWVEHDEVWHALTAQGKPLIHADYLQNLGFTGEGTAVAIVDTGVDYNHPTLGGGPIPNGKIVYGKDVANHDDDPMDCDTDSSHGTAVASIAAGLPYTWSSSKSFDGGVAPGASILAYKASRDASCGSFTSSDVTAAIEDAILQRDTYNVVAINLSIGGGSFDGPCDNRTSYGTAIDDATEAGMVVLAASGNEAKKDQLDSPACIANAVSVASVYDTSILGISYCGNDSCTSTLCTDSHVAAKTVTCYSNTNAYLDLFAPSEIVTAAEANGMTQSFGGTSAATPYATGAVALLYDAIPSMNPARARLLMEITGEPITDAANGVTRPLIDLETAYQGDSAVVGSETDVPIPNGTGTPAVSHATVSDTGFVESVRVLVKIAHPSPQDLVVSLVSPDGTRVKLHNHGDGTTPEGSIDASLGTNGIYAFYPDDLAPAESLDTFVGLGAKGTWTLEVLDDVATPTGGIAPRLIGWALQVTTKEAPQPPSQPAFLIPVAAHSSGAAGTFWVSDVRVLNTSLAIPASVQLYLIPKGSDGTVVFQQTNIQVPVNTVVSLPDIVQQRFGQTSLQGNLVFETDATGLVATSRTYNTGGGSGTYGQFIGMVSSSSTIGSADEPLVMPQLANSAAYRTNIGFSEIAGHSAQVRVTLYDGATGAMLGSPASYTIPAFSNQQLNGVFADLGATDSTNAYATVEVTGGSGRVTAYASVVDNATGDAIYIPGGHATTANAYMIPIVAKKGGAAGTNWVTDVRVYNPGPAVNVTLEFRPEQGTGGSDLTATRTIATGHQLALDDVLGSVFGLSNASGSLRVAPTGTGTALLATSRTYNDTGSGTYGQFIGAVTSGIGGGGSGTVIHLDKTAQSRSNLGLCEVAGGTAQVRYVLKDASGSTLGVGALTLQPYQVKQVNDVFAAVGAAGQANARVDLFLDGGTGAFTAYASVVDNTSGDAIYIPATAL